MGAQQSLETDLLIITNSYDHTTDLLLNKLAGQQNFRLNFDQFLRYKVQFDANGVRIADPSGRRFDSQALRKAYWRKPFNADFEACELDSVKYIEAECRYVLNEIVNLLWAAEKFVLVEPFAERRTGKLLQLRYAKTVFDIPPYNFRLDHETNLGDVVVKSLTNEQIEGKVLYSTRIGNSEIDARYPWFLQQYVDATHDVTIVFLCGQLFAFDLKRDFLDQSVDWRPFIALDQHWRQHALPHDLREKITSYMQILRLDYGRLDFLLDSEGRYWFCEVNPNGQFAWLDLDNRAGLVNAVAHQLSAATEHHPIQNCHPLSRP